MVIVSKVFVSRANIQYLTESSGTDYPAFPPNSGIIATNDHAAPRQDIAAIARRRHSRADFMADAARKTPILPVIIAALAGEVPCRAEFLQSRPGKKEPRQQIAR